MRQWGRRAAQATQVILLLFAAGCAGSGALVQDLQVTNAALKSETQQAYRRITELQVELQTLQRELGVARGAQARVEGELREGQRRVTDAQHVVDLQRDELTKSRDERERVVKTSQEMQGQLVELGRLREKAAEAERSQSRIQSLEAAVQRQEQLSADLKAMLVKTATEAQQSTSRPAKRKAAKTAVPASHDVADRSLTQAPPLRTVTVQAGDTLWHLAKKYRVSLDELRTLNGISTDLIVPEQELILPASPQG